MKENNLIKETECAHCVIENENIETVSVLECAYIHAKESIILSEQDSMFTPFLTALRKAYLQGFKYMKDGGQHDNIENSFYEIYGNLRDVGCGFWNSYKLILLNAYMAGAGLFCNRNMTVCDADSVDEALSVNGESLSCMELWAKNEIERVCKKHNPYFDITSDDFDYNDSCYKSAFKAYRSICNDGHSGFSYGFTKNILVKLLNSIPLEPITDDDFFIQQRGSMEHPLESEDYLMENGLKSDLQCVRMSSLFRKETLDGNISYTDVDRAYCFDIERPSDTYHGFGCNIVDELFPITMPYMPSSSKYAVATREFLTDKSHGDFDTIEIAYVLTPDNKRIDINRYFTDGRNVGNDDEKLTEITKEQYDELAAKRLDRVEDKITGNLIWTLTSNSHSDSENEILEHAYDMMPVTERENMENELNRLVIKNIVEPELFEYNTFAMHQAVCTQNDYYVNVISKIEGLREISEYLQWMYRKLKDSCI